MQHKHTITSNRIKVFISSSMKSDKYMEQRSGIISFFDRMTLYDCFAIETGSSPDDVIDRYTREVRRAHIVILILQEDLRPGVVKEFYTARENNKRIFAYIHNGEKSPDLLDFISGDVQKIATTSCFGSSRELIDNIEKDLLEDLVIKYVDLFNENKILMEELNKMRSGKITR